MCESKDLPNPDLRLGNLKKHVFRRYLDGEGWVWGPSKGLEGPKVWPDIIPHILLKMGKLGTKLVMEPLFTPKSDCE